MASYGEPGTHHSPSPEGLKFEDLDNFESERSGETGEIFSEAEVTEMAARLLDVTNEAEFDRVLGGVLSHAAQTVGETLTSSLGQAVGGLLKSFARQALPPTDTALSGSMGRAQRQNFGNRITAATGEAFGMELEGLGQDEAEFEVAKRYVRLAGDAARNAIEAASMGDPTIVAKSAVTSAANAYAPGLLITLAPTRKRTWSASRNKSTGRWIQVGDKTLVLNV
jgi:hypothetical protein